MASMAMIETNADGSMTIRPATQTDLEAAMVPIVTALIDSKIAASEQRSWQRMVDADANTATNVQTTVMNQIVAGLQAAVGYFGG
jgi:hypothetical protein